MAGKIVWCLMQYDENIKKLERNKIISVFHIAGTDDCIVAAKGVNKRSLCKISKEKI